MCEDIAVDCGSISKPGLKFDTSHEAEYWSLFQIIELKCVTRDMISQKNFSLLYFSQRTSHVCFLPTVHFCHLMNCDFQSIFVMKQSEKNEALNLMIL